VTVAELIAELTKLPQDAQVWLQSDSGRANEVSGTEFIKAGKQSKYWPRYGFSDEHDTVVIA
jgi:hypothetical protein